MTLNPNAVPWSGAEANADPTGEPVHQRMAGPHDPRYHGYSSYYQNQPPHSVPMMVPPQFPRHMMGGQGFHNAAHHGGPAMPLHNPPVQPYNAGRSRAQQYNAAPMSHMQPSATPSYRKAKPVVIVVFGYRRVGKTSVAQHIAETYKCKYISLKPKDKESDPSPAEFVAPLVDLLSRKNTFEGIVIDDIVLRNKFEPYYVQSVLQKSGLKIDVAVVLDNDLENTKERGVDYTDASAKQLHPESYEFCANYLQGEPILVVECRDKTLEEVVADASRQVGSVITMKDTTITLKDVELMPKCPLERNPNFVTEILEAQNQLLNLNKAALFPYSEPNYLLDYAFFVRHAYAFRSYMITPWMQGDKVILIGYQNAVYIHLPSYRIIFRFTEAPSTLLRLAKEKAGDHGVGFIFEATFAENKLYISDLFMLGDLKGSEMLVNERVDAMKENLSDLDDETVKLLPWYPVQSMETCQSENPEANGVLFVNPEGVMFGEYDSRNFLYFLHRKRTVDLRIWNGNFSNGSWTFDAYFEESGKEKLIEGVPVHISDADVSSYCINDGNILACALEDHHTGPNKAKKGTKHYVFQSRCNWMLRPTSVFRQEFFVKDPKWPLERASQACSSIKYICPTRPEVTATATADG
ncbi:uncharacterized protein TM35_000172260 [Trypanosoma theileri]|uniref:G5-interacting protein n=1 Tax=Trypanosoma theileri TaxID=67003 RepID=A0A1X0NUG5_9TRYP|nr:uncharacterized protein TM35_000172260 [Trypanosoma theileri]ORC88354.1 hypothetical protein TM35_000172260 [Trypanosoma theileri]